VATSEAPQHLLLPWNTLLLTAPRADAIALQLGIAEDDSSGRAVAVVGREGDFWQLETIDDGVRSELEVPVIEGLDFYRLRLYVPVGVGELLHAMSPGPEADLAAAPQSARAAAIDQARTSGVIGILGAMSSNPPVQTGELRSSASEIDFRVSPATVVYWADGREAGEVRREHAFVDAGELRSTDVGELRCFSIRVGLAYEQADGELCFAPRSPRSRPLASTQMPAAGSCVRVVTSSRLAGSRAASPARACSSSSSSTLRERSPTARPKPRTWSSRAASRRPAARGRFPHRPARWS
jgi:hypothetical protein